MSLIEPSYLIGIDRVNGCSPRYLQTLQSFTAQPMTCFTYTCVLSGTFGALSRNNSRLDGLLRECYKPRSVTSHVGTLDHQLDM
jgi:hypothetical protein